MITKQELIDLARFSHFKPHQQEKHYIQTIILNSIYSTVFDEVIFKGGTCLLFFYGLNRFSEDLDFTSTKEFDLRKLISNIKKDLENLGIAHRISKIEEDKTSISFKIGVEGPLFIREIERCHVSVEISKREEVKEMRAIELRTNYKEILGFNVNVMSKKEILAEKIRAILTRNKARDLFDAYFLLNKKVNLDLNLVNEKLKYYKTSFDKKEFLKAVKENREIWISELNPFVIGKLPEFREVEKIFLKILS